jgi:hypothetical protein
MFIFFCRLHVYNLFDFMNHIFYFIVGCSKFAMRGLSQCLANEFFAHGIHVAHVVIDGAICNPRLAFQTILFTLSNYFIYVKVASHFDQK